MPVATMGLPADASYTRCDTVGEISVFFLRRIHNGPAGQIAVIDL